MLKLSVIESEGDNNGKRRFKISFVYLGYIAVLFIICMTALIVFNGSLYKLKLNIIKDEYLFLIASTSFLLFLIHSDFACLKDAEKEERDMDSIYLKKLSSSLEYIILDTKKDRILISDKLAETIGYHGKSFISYKDYCKEYIHPDDFQEAKMNIDKTIDSLVLLDLSAKYRLKNFNGKFEWFQSRRAIIKDNYGNPIKIIEIYQNINKTVEYYKKRLKTNQINAQKRENTKTDFLNYICHEFKTPLNIVLGAIQLVELMDKNRKGAVCDVISTDKLYKYIRLMKQNTYRLIRLINNMLDITKIDKNYLLLDLTNENIVEIVEDIVLSVSEFINNKNIKLIFNTEIEEKIIACDKDKIERVVLNLLSNAIKYTNSGGNIYVNIWEKDGKVFLLVEDTGIGIPYNIQKDIFDIYKQVDFRSKREKQGSGIGLSLVKSILDLHGGRIWVESEVNKGSKFFVELPDKAIDNGYIKEKTREDSNGMVEKINIEFSDIYSF